MKYIFLVLFTIILFCKTSYSQIKQLSKNDLIEHTKAIQQKLHLSDSTAEAMITITLKHMAALDSFNHDRKLTGDAKSKKLAFLEHQYYNGMKALLTQNQWDSYQQIQTSLRDSIRNANKKNEQIIQPYPNH
jgi:hypothetical protein